MESYSVEAVLSAVDNGFTSAMKGAANNTKSLDNQTQKASVSMSSILKGVGIYKAVSAGVNVLTSSLGGAIERYDKLSQFPKVLEGLGASTEDAKRATDKLKEGIDGLPTTLQEVAQTTQQMYSVFKDADKAADSTLALNNAMLASGSTGDKAARGTEQYMKILRTGKVELDSFTTLQETMGVGLDKVAAKFGKTGASAQSDLYSALKSGEISVDQFNQALIDLQDGLGGTADLAKKNSEGIQTSFTNMKNAVKNGMATTIETIDKVLKDKGLGGIAGVLDNVKVAIKNAFAAFNGALPDIIDKVAAALKFFGDNADWLVPILGGLAGAFASLSVINTVTSTIDNAKKAISSVTTAIGFLTSPVGLAVVAIGLLVAAGIFLYKNWDQIKAGAEVIWNAVSSTVTGVVDSIVQKWEELKAFMSNLWDGTKETATNAAQGVQDAWNGIGEWFSDLWTEIKKTASDVWDSIVRTADNAVKAVQNAWDGTTQWFSDLWEGVKSTFKSFVDFIMQYIGPLVYGVRNAFTHMSLFLNTLWNELGKIAGNAFEIIKNVILAPILFVTSMLSGGWEEAKNNMIGIWENIKESAANIWNSIKAIFDNFLLNVKMAFMNVWIGLKMSVINIWTEISTQAVVIWTSIMEFFSNLWIGIKTTASDAWNFVKNTAIQSWLDTKQGAIDTWNAIKQWFSDTWSAIKTNATQTWQSTKEDTVQTWNDTKQSAIDIWEAIKKFFVDTFNNIVNGAAKAWEDLKQGVLDAVQAVKDTFNTLREIDLFEIGKNIIDGLIKGIQEKAQAVRDAVTDVADGITSKVKSVLGIHSPSRVMRDQVGRFIPQGIAEGIEKDASYVDKAVSKLGVVATNSFDLGLNVADMNSQIQGNVSHEVNMTSEKQPAYIHFSLGERDYKTFVEDIANAMGGTSELYGNF